MRYHEKSFIKSQKAKGSPQTQEEIAEELGVSDRQLRYWQEKDTDAAISSCIRLSQLLMIPVEELLIFQEDPQTE